MNELIDALRCESVINDEHPRCESCKYGVLSFHGNHGDVYGCDARRIDYDAADAIEELISRLPKWISVNERLPVSQELVIVSVCDTTGDTEFSYTSFGWLTSEKEYWIVDGEENGYVTHWMKLPEPSKGERVCTKSW